MEILGAWLGLWTPPRDEVVPPVPWRAVVGGAAALVVVLGVAAALVLPGVSADRRAARERDEQAQAREHARMLATVEREQRPRVRPGPPARTVAARQRAMSAASAAIARDARTRTPKRIHGVDCERFPRTIGGTDAVDDLTRSAGLYDCTAVTARLPGGGIIGMGFRLVQHFDRGGYAWCRVIPLGDQDRLSHPLPAACRLPAN